MRPRCSPHNRVMLWIPQAKLWRCRMRGCPEVSISAPPRHLKEKARKLRDPRTDVRTFEGGREVLKGKAKRARWMEVYRLDGSRCVECGKVLDPPYSQSVNAAEIHHVNSRGMSGSRRDDRIVSEGKRQLETRCGTCHHRVNARPQWNQQEKEKQP